jgi:hypothetical protein
MELEERQLIIFIHHLGIEHVGVQTFDPQDKGKRQPSSSDYVPNEGQQFNSAPLNIKPLDK